MRFLHTSDWHIGRQFHNNSLLEDQAYVLDQILAIAKDQNIDALLIAGDVYDRSVPPANAVELLDQTFDKICRELKVPLIVIAGNHDGPQRLGFASKQMTAAGLHIAGPLTADTLTVTLEDRHGKVDIYGIPFCTPSEVQYLLETKTATYDQAVSEILSRVRGHHHKSHRSIVVSHLFINGCEASESERPLSIGGLDKVSSEHFKPFNYTALGHLHAPQSIGADHIRYSGSILKYSFSEENQQKSVSIVEMDKSGSCTLEKIPLSPRRDLRVIEGKLSELLKAAESDPAKQDYLLVRLTDTHAILDIMSKLRDVYPNVLHLERPGLITQKGQHMVDRNLLKKGELTMFGDFYQQMSGTELTADQSALITKTLDKIHQSREE